MAQQGKVFAAKPGVKGSTLCRERIDSQKLFVL